MLTPRPAQFSRRAGQKKVVQLPFEQLQDSAFDHHLQEVNLAIHFHPEQIDRATVSFSS